MAKMKIEPFERYGEEYDAWFDEHRHVYEAELRAIRALLPKTKMKESENGSKSIEIGVGSGRFAAPLGITLGIDPAPGMRLLAKARGIEVIGGIAEALPLRDSHFELVLMVTTICFLDNAEKAFREVYRVLKPYGCFIIAFIDRDSPLGAIYSHKKSDSPFYRVARFYNTREVIALLKDAGFNKEIKSMQTIFRFHTQLEDEKEEDKVEEVRQGYGKGSFVVLKVVK